MGMIQIGWKYHWTDSFLLNKGCVPNKILPLTLLDSLPSLERVAALQQPSVTQVLKKLFKDTQWTVEQLSFVARHKSVYAIPWYDLLLKFGVSKEERIKIMKNLVRSLLDEVENVFRS